MCGRFVQTVPPDQLRKRFGTKNPLANADPSWNVAPTDWALAVRWNRETNERSLDKLRWGLVPMWAPDLSVAARQINARAETLAQRPAYREAYAKRRCLVPITAFYEWEKRPDGSKQPYAVGVPDGSPMVLGGLWERWRDKATGEITRSFTVVTVPACPQIAHIHDRMPLVVAEPDWPAWLGETGADPAPLLRTYAQPLKVWPVSARVSSVRNNDSTLLDPLPAS